MTFPGLFSFVFMESDLPFPSGGTILFPYLETPPQENQTMKTMIACCGLNCEKCDAYLATIHNDQARLASHFSQSRPQQAIMVFMVWFS